MPVMNIQEHVKTLRQQLKHCPATRDQVSRASGGKFSASWLSKFAAGRMANPRIDTLIALEEALRACRNTVVDESVSGVEHETAQGQPPANASNSPIHER